MATPLLDREAMLRLKSTLAASSPLPAEDRGRLDAATIGFLAHALPKRAAVWWGALCTWKVARPAPNKVEDEALRAAVGWAIDGGEASRQAALAPGQAAGLATPAGCLALAASWSAGSLSPHGLPPVATPEDVTGRLVRGAVLLAAVQGDALAFRERYREFVHLGAEVAAGSLRWDS